MGSRHVITGAYKNIQCLWRGNVGKTADIDAPQDATIYAILGSTS